MPERLTKSELDSLGVGIDSLLRQQLDRIKRRFLTHGVGWVVAALCGLALGYFLLDRALLLPPFVRVVMTIAFLAFVTLSVKRRVLYPMTKPLSTSDVAVAVERKFPELREKLISAVQLKGLLAPADAGARDRELRGESRAMIEHVVAEAAEAARALPLNSVLDPSRTLRLWGIAAVTIAVAGLAVSLNPVAATVFLQRAIGLSTAYPRLTTLIVELPEEGRDFRIQRAEGTATVTLAAGADLPVLVRAEGVQPREVQLVIEGGRGMPPDVAMTKRPNGRFRHVFRRIDANFAFHARGGDDPRGDLLVRIETIHPPLVGTIQAQLDYPAYTGLPDAVQSGGSIEALAGTHAKLTVVATAPVAQATLHFLDADARLSLRPISIQDDSGVGQSFAGEFVIETTDRYQVELVSPQGLRNPNPGIYPVIAQQDHEPVGRLLQPPADDILVVVPGALVPLRVTARDDFGLASVTVVAQSARNESEQLFPMFTAPGPEPDPQPDTAPDPRPDTAPITELVATDLIDLAVFPGGTPQVGDSLTLTARLVDNREPEPATSELQSRHVHVVDAADLARRIAGHFRRLREEVVRSFDVQTDRRALTAALLEELDAIDDDTVRRGRLVTVEVGQGRVSTAAERIRTDLMRAFDVHLFNRLDESIHAPKVVELYLRYHRENASEDTWLPGFYRKVADERRSGRIGAMERTLDPILEMTVRADRIVEDLAANAVDNLAAAGVAAGDEERRTLLRATLQLQDQILIELQALDSRLAEWNEFQDVVQQARALRDQQRDVENRTRTLEGAKK